MKRPSTSWSEKHNKDVWKETDDKFKIRDGEKEKHEYKHFISKQNEKFIKSYVFVNKKVNDERWNKYKEL